MYQKTKIETDLKDISSHDNMCILFKFAVKTNFKMQKFPQNRSMISCSISCNQTLFSGAKLWL